MADHGFALIAKIADERTDTNFVVAISAFKLIDLRLNKRLKFNSACECTLNAFVHRSNFATNSLAQCGYTITGGGFRLQELESSFRHAARCDMHFLSTADEMCKAPEHDHRQYCTSDYANTGGGCEEIFGRLKVRKDIRADCFANRNATGSPEHAHSCRCPIELGRTFGYTARRSSNGSAIARIIIGRRKGGSRRGSNNSRYWR